MFLHVSDCRCPGLYVSVFLVASHTMMSVFSSNCILLSPILIYTQKEGPSRKVSYRAVRYHDFHVRVDNGLLAVLHRLVVRGVFVHDRSLREPATEITGIDVHSRGVH